MNEDHFDIKTLPSHFVSQSHPSEIIEILYEKRRRRHSETTEEMNIRMKEVNDEIEEEILAQSNATKTKIRTIRDDIDYSLYIVLQMREHEFPLNSKRFLQNKSNKIRDANDVRKTHVEKHHKALVELEKRRTDKFKQILNGSYTTLLGISHKLPFELEQFFEKQLLNINQLTLANLQHYIELEAELNLQIENDMRVWMGKLYELKKKFKDHFQNSAATQSGFVKLDFDDDRFDKGTQCRRLSEYDALKMVLEFKLSQMSLKSDFQNIDLWLQEVQMKMACSDKSAKYIVNIYKATIVVIFHRFFNELEDIKTSMLDINMLNRDDIETYECEIYTPSVEELNVKSEAEFRNLQKVWGNLMTYIESSLNETFFFVKTATTLWDRHFIRTEEAQNLVLKDVNNTIERNIIKEEMAERGLNIILDALRQATSEQKLEKYLIDVQKSLEKIEEIYHVHIVDEQKIFEKYRELVDIEIEVLMAEIRRFLTLHPPDEERDPKKQRKRASQESIIRVDSTEDLIPPQMLFCRYQVDAVRNWMFGLWEAINHYVSCGRAEIKANAEDWIQIQCERIKLRLELKLSFCKLRYERIKCSVYEKRLDELRRHSRRLKRHEMAVNTHLKNLLQREKLNDDKYNDILKTFTEEAEITFKQALKLSKSTQVRRCKEVLKITARETVDTMITVLEDITNSCDKLAEDVSISNFKFKYAIRLFSENGNFFVTEAKDLVKYLNKLNANANKQLDTIRKDNKERHLKYRNKLEAISAAHIADIQEIIEEFEHNERIVEIIMHIQKEIRELVITLKTPAVKLKKQFKKLLDASTEKIGQTDYLEIFAKRFQDIVEEIDKAAPFLMHPAPVVLYTSMTNFDGASTITTKSEPKNYLDYFVSVKTNEGDECFLSKINNSLYNSFDRIQVDAKAFYNKRTILLEFPKIQPTFDKFMEEVLQKYKNFLIQCEICWLETATDFLLFLDNFWSFKLEYLSAFEDKFYNVSLENLKKIYTATLKTLYEEKDSLENAYRDMYSKLKALHGHPKNKHLLDQIQEECKKMIGKIDNILKLILPPYKAILQNEFEKIQSNYEVTMKLLKINSQGDDLEDLLAKLREQLEQKLDIIKQLIDGEDKKTVSSGNDKQQDLPQSATKLILTYMEQAHGPPVTSDTRSSATTVASMYETPHRDFLNELHGNYEKYKKDITGFINIKLFKIFKDFQQAWKNDIEKLVNLYKVKYDQKHIQTPETASSVKGKRHNEKL